MRSPANLPCLPRLLLAALALPTGAMSTPLENNVRSQVRPRAEAPGNSTQKMVNSFDEITPSPDINWVPCFGNFTCTRLVVPLDYEAPEVGTTELAYIKYAAANETVDTPNIQINGGGPGISGVDLILANYPTFVDKLGSQYNLIGFDPRGINNSGPSLDCFPGDPETKALFEQKFDRIIDYQDKRNVRDFYYSANAVGEWCADVHRSGPASYANTVAVASDLVNFAEKQAIANNQNPDDAKVWFQAGSYGSVLGMTFASLYPDKVGRVLIDSIVDSDEYYAGRYINLVRDGPKAMESLFKKCHEAGEEKCGIWAESPEAVGERTMKILDALRMDPIPLSSRQVAGYPQIVTYKDWALFLAWNIMNEAQYPYIASVLYLLEQRNGGYLVDVKNTLYIGTGLEPWATTHISCLDAAGRLDLSTPEKWEEYVQETVDAVGPWIVDDWAVLAGMCSKGRDIYPPPHQTINGTLSANSTYNPILFMSNTIDAATSIDGARKKHADFPGSGFLEQRVDGHGVLLSFTSSCTKDWVQKYLADATLPPEGTICEAEDPSSWDDPALNPFLSLSALS